MSNNSGAFTGFPGWNGETPNTPRPGWAIEEYLEQLVHTAAVLALPPVTEENNGDFMTVVDGEWAPADVTLDEKIEADVDEWLEDHPEATTTVQDGAITFPKLAADLKSLLVHDTVSGPVANFDYAVGGLPFDSVVASIEPTQDLHGYSHPWPAGGGKNLLDPSARTGADGSTTYRWYEADGITLHAGQAYTFSCESSSARLYFRKKADGTDLVTNPSPITYTPSEDVVVFLQAYKSAGITATQFQLELGSTATAYAPYSNICPISGRTGLSVYDDPKYGGTIEWNQLIQTPNSSVSETKNGITLTDNRDGSFSVSGTASADVTFTITSSPVAAVQGHKYIVFGCPQSGSPTSYWWQTGNAVVDSGSGIIYNRGTSATNSWYGTIRVKSGTVITEPVIFRPQYCDLTEMFGAGNEPSTVAEFKALFPKEYYAYNSGITTCVSAVNGDPYWKKDIDWTTPAGTVYGGTVDVTTGVLTVDRASVDLGTLNWSMIGSTNKYFQSDALIGSIKPPVNSSTLANAICEEYKCVTWSDPTYESGRFAVNGDPTPSRGKIGFINTNYTSAADFKTAMSGIKLVYELATPLTYQLTPKQIAALTENYVWASNGGNVSVTFIADTKSYIDRKIAEAIAAALNA